MTLRAMDTETQDGYAILITRPDAFAETLCFSDCMSFLRSEREWVCWNADYDVQAILKYLPRIYRERLAVTNECRYRNVLLRYVPSKFLMVWERNEGSEKWRLLFTVYDLQQFYACSLKRAAIKLGVEAKDTIPESWYTQMYARLKDPKTREKVLTYALQDSRTLQAIIDLTVEAFAIAGIKFAKPFSNATFSERYFHNKFRYRKEWGAERMARQAYHGGRIECLRTGTFARAWHYDLHSAYPSVIAELEKPDGEWFYERARKDKPVEIRSDSRYAFVDCQIKIPATENVGPIPYRRRSGSIVYPVGKFRKVITLTEYRYLETRKWIVKIYQAWQHVWTSRTYPFSEIREIYDRRKADKRLDYALKIVMNATYGKFAQIISGSHPAKIIDVTAKYFDGKFWFKKEQWEAHTSFVYAAEITARIRIRLISEIPQNAVICYSTDGVFCHKPVKIPTGPGLGEWSDPEIVKYLTVVGSGVYCYTDNDGQEHVKFRGFSPDIDLGVMLYRAGRRHSLGMNVTRNTSIKLAYIKQSPREMNVLRKVVRFLDVNFDSKRVWSHSWTARNLMLNQYESKPWIVYPTVKVKRWI